MDDDVQRREKAPTSSSSLLKALFSHFKNLIRYNGQSLVIKFEYTCDGESASRHQNIVNIDVLMSQLQNSIAFTPRLIPAKCGIPPYNLLLARRGISGKYAPDYPVSTPPAHVTFTQYP